MTRVALPLLSLALGAIVLGSGSKSKAGILAQQPEGHSASAAGSIARALAVVAPTANLVSDDYVAARRRLLDSAGGTYIGDILLERDQRPNALGA